MSTGKLVVFEGPDGVGKSSVSSAVALRYKDSHPKVLHYAFPGKEKGTLGELVYRAHHGELLDVTPSHPVCIQIMHVAAHIDAIKRIIFPALSEGGLVFLDRYWWSTWVYGINEGIEESLLDSLIAIERQVWADVQPDMLILFERNLSLKSEEDHFTWKQRMDLYYSIANREKNNHPIRIISNDKKQEDATEEVMTILNHIGL